MNHMKYVCISSELSINDKVQLSYNECTLKKN
jgi:hypothetical protein